MIFYFININKNQKKSIFSIYNNNLIIHFKDSSARILKTFIDLNYRKQKYMTYFLLSNGRIARLEKDKKKEF